MQSFQGHGFNLSIEEETGKEGNKGERWPLKRGKGGGGRGRGRGEGGAGRGKRAQYWGLGSKLDLGKEQRK